MRVNDKNELKFSIISFYNGESRGLIILNHIMASKFNIQLRLVFSKAPKRARLVYCKTRRAPTTATIDKVYR